MYTIRQWLAHPGRNPEHSPTWRSRWIVDPIRGMMAPKILWYPRNPSRWLPHVGGAKASVRPNVVPTITVTRQQRRWNARQEQKQMQSRYKIAFLKLTWAQRRAMIAGAS